MAGRDDAIDVAALDAAADALDKAGESRHSTRAYQGDIRHYEHDFGGAFPATPDDIRRYIAKYSSTLSPATLRRRISSIAKFHRLHGYADPTRNERVGKTQRGVRATYNRPPVQARPLTIAILARLVNQWDALVVSAGTAPHDDRRARHVALQAIRAKAFFLLGFWLGLRADELVRLDVAFCTFNRDSEPPALEVFLPSSKGDHAAAGSAWTLPALPLYCPVAAYLDWIKAAGISDGPVFRKIHRWANILNDGLHVNSVFVMIRAALRAAGLDDAELDGYSSHSLRRGFATEFTRHGGGLKELMAWVKWKSTDNALRYIEAAGDAPLSLMSEWLRAQGVDLPTLQSSLHVDLPNTPTTVVPTRYRTSQSTTPSPASRLGALRASFDMEVFDEDASDADSEPFKERFAKVPARHPQRTRRNKTTPSQSRSRRRRHGDDDTGATKTAWRIKVTLLEVHPTVWRRVEVAPTITIRQLHDIVQAAMGWENYHLWDMGIEPARTLIDVADIGTEFGYLYDFGDEWRHAIVIEKAVAMKSGHPYPTCIGGSNACPPEDCGGPYGYREFLKIVRGPDTYEREELLEVYGGKFNPKKFDIDVANENLKDLIDASKEN